MENLINALEELFIKYNVNEDDIIIIEDAINNLNAVETEDYESDYSPEDEYEEDVEDEEDY